MMYQNNPIQTQSKDYAESYIECKDAGNMDRAKIYYQMAQDELKHADNLHKQRDAHGYFVEKAAWVKQMLAL